jgi:hypothetical protein
MSICVSRVYCESGTVACLSCTVLSDGREREREIAFSGGALRNLRDRFVCVRSGRRSSCELARSAATESQVGLGPSAWRVKVRSSWSPRKYRIWNKGILEGQKTECWIKRPFSFYGIGILAWNVFCMKFWEQVKAPCSLIEMHKLSLRFIAENALHKKQLSKQP